MKFSRYLFGFYLGISRLGSSPPAARASAPIAATVPRPGELHRKAADAQGKAIAGRTA
jgi:hypothetical protein